MKKFLIVPFLSFITVLVLWAQTPASSVLRSSFEVPVEQSRLVANALYDQITAQPGTQAITSAYFDNAAAVWQDKHNMGADDFIVPVMQIWNVDAVEVVGAFYLFGGTPTDDAEGFNLAFYEDNGSGQVGNLVASYSDLAYTATLGGSHAGSFIIPLPSSLSLTTGRYWVSVQIIKNPCSGAGDCLSGDGTFVGQWGWQEAGTNTPIMGESKWQNPAGGWAAGNACQPDVCASWGNRITQCGIGITYADWATCTGPSDPPRDFKFAIAGIMEIAPPPVPTMGEWALILFAGLLAGAGLVLMRRKS